jgi:hypothetical protein
MKFGTRSYLEQHEQSIIKNKLNMLFSHVKAMARRSQRVEKLNGARSRMHRYR